MDEELFQATSDLFAAQEHQQLLIRERRAKAQFLRNEIDKLEADALEGEAALVPEAYLPNPGGTD